MEKINSQALFLVGFRPLFPLAMFGAIVLPILWALVFSGKVSWLSTSDLNPMAWHAHEMLFGFSWAVLGGFLLTASKNWVKIRGLHGLPLLGVCLFWVLERFVILFPQVFGGIDSMIWLLFMNLYIFAVAGYILWCLVRYRATDSYKDNFFFYLILALFILSKNMLLRPEYYKLGIDISVGLFRLAFAVMFERTLTQFMKNTEAQDLLRNPILDYGIKFLLFIGVFYPLLPQALAATILFLAALLLLVRWLLWKPFIGFKKFSNATMYIGYLGLILHLILEGCHQLGHTIGSPTTALHTFTFLCMGVVIPSMFIRICQGHTGRKPQFFMSDKIAISCMLVGAFFRLLMPVIAVRYYAMWISIAAIFWSLCFLIIAVRLVPYCLQPRIDGKEH